MLHDPISTVAAVPLWTQDPRAARILASFAKHEPAYATIDPADRWTSREDMYAGYRVECLDRIWNEAYLKVRQPVTADGDWSEFDAFMGQPRVQEAIHEALNPAAPERSLWDVMMSDVAAALRPASDRVLA